jgi:hypothetical protein
MHQQTYAKFYDGIGGLRVQYGRTFIQPRHNRFEQLQVFFLQSEAVGRGTEIQSLCELLPECCFIPAGPGSQNVARLVCGRHRNRIQIGHDIHLIGGSGKDFCVS